MAPRQLHLNWGGPGYAEYQGYCKVSKGEQQAAQAQAQASQAMAQQARVMTGIMQQQFAQQQSVLSVLMPQLKAMATNPQGFGVQAMAAMTSATINTLGGQLASQQQALRQQFATSNLAGLGSGAQAAISAGLSSSAAGAEASNLQQLAIANAQAKQQQQQFALSGMSGLAGMSGQQALSAGGMGMQGLSSAMQGATQQFQMQQQMAQQGSFWQNFAAGALGDVGTAMSGGMTNMLGRVPGIGQFF